jgi:transposase
VISEGIEMTGRQVCGQERLFYSFNLEDHVPRNHLLRGIDRCLDLGGLHKQLADHYSQIGRPSIDPELMLRMLIVGYCYGIRSERRLCEEVLLNLAYRWFCHLGLDDAIPDHSTFSKNRLGRFRESGTFRWLFDEVVRRCMAAGLVKAAGFAVDASIVAADASRQRGVPGTEAMDWKDLALSTRAVREYLESLDADALGEVLPKNISLTDPQSSWTEAPGGPAFYAYSTNYLIDTEHGVIVDVEATPAHRTVEVESTKTMIDRVEERFDLKPERLIGDTAYGTAAMQCMDGRREGHRAARARVGPDSARGRHVVASGVRVERAGQRIPLPSVTCPTQPVAPLQDRAHPHHQGRHDHLPRQPA